MERGRSRGSGRTPSLRIIEREAYRWADAGIDTQKLSNLTQGEEKYLKAWADWGFSDEVIRMAYDKTCMNTGALKWPYMHSILKSWNAQGLTTVDEIPFSLIWCGFVVFWEYTTLKSGAPVFFLLFGILFVLAGLFLTVGRFLLAAYRDRRTSYALTSERIIAQTGSTRKALELATLPRMSVIQRSDGTGDIRFGEMAVYGRMAGLESVRFHNQSSLMELRNIPDVNQVEYRIRTAADQAVRARRQEDR